VTVFLGKGDGSLQAGVPFAVAHPTSIVAMDFNGDGKKDIAVADYKNNSATILLNTSK
jgi:FG-GAP-like repeat